MGLFRNIGRKVEEFKRTSESVAAEEARYKCSDCGKRLYTSHDACPECGGTVVQVADESETSDSGEGEATTGDDNESEATDE
jgi:rRNA maturation endonuclease Nob1